MQVLCLRNAQVLIVDAGSTGVVSIGLAGDDHPLTRHPGWEPRTFGLAVLTGEVYSGGEHSLVSIGPDSLHA